MNTCKILILGKIQRSTKIYAKYNLGKSITYKFVKINIKTYIFLKDSYTDEYKNL